MIRIYKCPFAVNGCGLSIAHECPEEKFMCKMGFDRWLLMNILKEVKNNDENSESSEDETG